MGVNTPFKALPNFFENLTPWFQETLKTQKKILGGFSHIWTMSDLTLINYLETTKGMYFSVLGKPSKTTMLNHLLHNENYTLSNLPEDPYREYFKRAYLKLMLDDLKLNHSQIQVVEGFFEENFENRVG